MLKVERMAIESPEDDRLSQRPVKTYTALPGTGRSELLLDRLGNEPNHILWNRADDFGDILRSQRMLPKDRQCRVHEAMNDTSRGIRLKRDRPAFPIFSQALARAIVGERYDRLLDVGAEQAKRPLEDKVRPRDPLRRQFRR